MQISYSKPGKSSESAFDLTPNPRFFYANGAFQETFLALRYGIKLRKALIILTGQSGTGKTSLIALIKDRRESNTRLAIVPNAGEESSLSLRLILRALGLTETLSDRQAQVEEIRRYLIEQRQRNKIVALIVDRAHELNLDALQELESLLKLKSDGEHLLQIVLVGRPELEAKLAEPALESFKQRVALWCRVEPLQRDEVGAYIDHRLACAGQQQGGSFQAGAVERIAAYSKGIPGLINTICRKALLSAHAASSDQITAGTVDRVWDTLRRTGETEFEVAALLSEIRHYSGPASRYVETTRRNPEFDVGWRREAQFPLEESVSGVKRIGDRKLRKFMPWLSRLRRDPQKNVYSWLAVLTHSGGRQITGRLGELPERVKRSMLPEMGTAHDRGAGRSNSRWLGWPLVIGMLLLVGSLAVLSSGPSADRESYNRQNVREEAGSRQAAKMHEQGEMTGPEADVQPLIVPEASHPVDMSQQPDGPQQAAALQPAAIPQHTGEQPVNEGTDWIQILNSPETGTPANQFAPIVYVHTSEERDRAVLDEIGNVLRVDGYAVRDTRFAPYRTRGDVRFFFPLDRREAERVKAVVQSELGKRGYSLSLQLLERDGKKFKHAAPGKIEVWLPALRDAQVTPTSVGFSPNSTLNTQSQN